MTNCIMNRRGAIGIAALWILLAASALATAAISMARAERKTAAYRLEEFRLTYLIVDAALADRDANFVSDENEIETAHGKLRATRAFSNNKKSVRWIARADGPHFSKQVEIGWTHEAPTWRADYWSELK